MGNEIAKTWIRMFLVIGIYAFAISSSGDSIVTFNEMMYHPAADESTLEWIELYNQMSYDMDISRWEIRGGIDYVFPQGTFVPASGFLILAISPSDFELETGYANAFGPYEDHLDNTGENLQLMNNSGRVMDRINYRDCGDWPAAPDGSGVSLVKIDPNTASAEPENWAWSPQMGGSPAERNFFLPHDVINPMWEIPLIEETSPVWASVPVGDSLGTTWLETSFNHLGWLNGTNGVGYEVGTGYESLIHLDVKTQMDNIVQSCYIRIPFTVDDPSVFYSFALWMRYDDGFVAYLNGQEVARSNAPAPLTWNSGAAAGHDDSQAIVPEPFNISEFINLLQTGTNVLAIHGLNYGLGSTDFLIVSKLTATKLINEPSNKLVLKEMGSSKLVLNEISSAQSGTFRVELMNCGNDSISLAGYVLTCAGAVNGEYIFPPEMLEPNSYKVIDATAMGFHPLAEDKLFVYNPDRDTVMDAAVVKK